MWTARGDAGRFGITIACSTPTVGEVHPFILVNYRDIRSAMNVLITGSSGYVGISIIKVLLDHGCRVTGFSIDTVQDFSENPHFHQIIGDVTHFGDVFDALSDIDVVIHSAVGSRITPELLAKYQEDPPRGDLQRVAPFHINVGGTFNVLEAAQQRGIRQVINISSCAVIYHRIIDPVDGHVNKIFVDAQTSPAFRGEYGLSKYLQEQIGWHYAQSYGISTPTFRPWWVVDASAGLTRFNDRLVDDPVDALGSAGWVDRYDLGEAVLAAINRPDLTQEIFYPMSTDDGYTFFDVKYLEETLGWRPSYRFEEETQIRKDKGLDQY
jgi:nucleoside-diphosphate-sugar epimerase